MSLYVVLLYMSLHVPYQPPNKDKQRNFLLLHHHSLLLHLASGATSHADNGARARSYETQAGAQEFLAAGFAGHVIL